MDANFKFIHKTNTKISRTPHVGHHDDASPALHLLPSLTLVWCVLLTEGGESPTLLHLTRPMSRRSVSRPESISR